MARPLVCLCLTAKTLAENVKIVESYKDFIDLVELRVDFLETDERLQIRDFPSMIDVPAILTIRQKIDGGLYEEGESSRTMLFARALAFADENPKKNFAYVDFEEDYHVPSLEDAAQAFGIKIIRSYHNMSSPVEDIVKKFETLRQNNYEIPKIAFMPHTLKDITKVFEVAESWSGSEQIFCAMGHLGLPTRILSEKLHSYLTYTSPSELLGNLLAIGHIDPITLNNVYRFRNINKNTKLFGITGYPLTVTSSPEMHNALFKKNNLDAVYIPFKSETIENAMNFAEVLDIKGFSVTIPHKETVIPFLKSTDKKAQDIGACNTVVRDGDSWKGYNTDALGFKKALLEFTGLKNLKGKRVAIIGAGGASRAIAYVVKECGAKACVFNRTLSKARIVAEKYGFEFATLGPENLEKLKKYSQIIVQTTSKGMASTEPSNIENDAIWFYDFSGKEFVYDIVYSPEVTPVMARAASFGCKVCNGLSMLRYQGEAQFDLFKQLV
ncbi:type I 3-dehydroquinate dehydratase [Treponema pectinovorum]|uniref:type I 3-dehydroquinate dehydratase n=1 Tax=Treponema pectinovorum TaxID=164 RepID=UPI0011F0A537|nr:type I 3-dehydroquinate dehydratase [Treponema pectinovorum]